MRIQFDAVSVPAGFLGGEQSGAASGKGIQDNAASLRTVEDSVANQGEWFRCWMSAKRCLSVLSEAAHTGIFPDVRAVPAKSS